MPERVDVVILGAGAAGLMCAYQAGLLGHSVLLLDHAHKLAEKIRISGGGRCNFTNLQVSAADYVSQNPHFCRSALARFTPDDFMALMQQHGLTYHEKTQGQLFCDQKSGAVIDMLDQLCQSVQVQRRMGCQVIRVESLPQNEAAAFAVQTSQGRFESAALVVATGGLSVPKIGATGLGHQLAAQFDIPVVPTRPALVPLIVDAGRHWPFSQLSGCSLPVRLSVGGTSFTDQLLFTHKGISGPAVLQISNYWEAGQPLQIDWLPQQPIDHWLSGREQGKKQLSTVLSALLPKKFVAAWLAWMAQTQKIENLPVRQYDDSQKEQLAQYLHDWAVVPAGTAGWNKAEVTAGGVDTRALSSKTMEARQVPGLYFIGEVVDVTGRLGGYNFQWAWASAVAAAQALS